MENLLSAKHWAKAFLYIFIIFNYNFYNDPRETGLSVPLFTDEEIEG